MNNKAILSPCSVSEELWKILADCEQYYERTYGYFDISLKDYSKVEFFTYDEGLCVQCMHNGSYDSEFETTEKMATFVEENGFALDINESRFHHEIYISDPRKTVLDKLKIVLRHPIKLN